jgi:hypothetical protein
MPNPGADGIDGIAPSTAPATPCDPDAEGKLGGATETLPGTPAPPIRDNPSTSAPNPESAAGAADASDTPANPNGVARSGGGGLPTASGVGIEPIDGAAPDTEG